MGGRSRRRRTAAARTMFRSLYIGVVYTLFLFLGIGAPFVLSLGYVWVDTFSPQNVAYSILTDFPVSGVMAVAAIGGYLIYDRRAPPRITLILVLTLCMAFWVTCTTLNEPVSPAQAWYKWNWAIKTILFSAFMPLAFRSRIQIEAFLQIYLFSLAGAMIPYAAKTILSGGSYGANLGLEQGNSGLAEGAFLATNCTMMLPVILHLARHGKIMPRNQISLLIYIGLAVAAVCTTFGTLERTGLVGLVVAGIGLWLRARRRLLLGLLGGLAGVLVAGYLVQSAWTARMETLTNVTADNSALARIEVWKWTLGFVGEHPLGGGFNSFYVDTIVLPGASYDPRPITRHGIAFHSIYFEVLGEHGWPGLAIFLSLIAASFTGFISAARRARRLADMEWCSDLAWTAVIAMSVLVVCGAFIGIAFTPIMYYMFALAVMLPHHVRMVEKERRSAAIQLADMTTEYYEPAAA
jgi:probable O-glycosylation ligase (exosortase A-associated)